MWLPKQHTGHRGTRVQVGYYSGNPNRDVGCSNCVDEETISHLYMCPNEDRVRLFTEGVDKVNKWLEKQYKTSPEIS